MQGKRNPGNRQAGQGIHYLLCDIFGQSEVKSGDGELVCGPIQCLHKALNGRPDIIAVRFAKTAIREREALVELCAVLKQNSHTKEIPALALLDSKHRKVIEDLERARVDYVRYVGKVILDSALMLDIIQGLGPDDRTQRHLAMLCPFAHYRKVDSQHEMTLCGAYRDRMVLGGRRLSELCETDDHLQCEYFLNPRLKS